MPTHAQDTKGSKPEAKTDVSASEQQGVSEQFSAPSHRDMPHHSPDDVKDRNRSKLTPRNVLQMQRLLGNKRTSAIIQRQTQSKAPSNVVQREDDHYILDPDARAREIAAQEKRRVKPYKPHKPVRHPMTRVLSGEIGWDEAVASSPKIDIWTVSEFRDKADSMWDSQESERVIDLIAEELADYHINYNRPTFQMRLVKNMMENVEQWLKMPSHDRDGTIYRDMKFFGNQLQRRYEELRQHAGTQEHIQNAEENPKSNQSWHVPQDKMADRFPTISQEFKGSPDAMFAKMAGVVDGLIPGVGKAKIDIEFTWPVAGAPGVADLSLGGHVVLEAERSPDDDVKVVSEVTFIGVAEADIGIWAAKLKAEVGGFLEAQADNSGETLNAISLSLFKRMLQYGDDTLLAKIAYYLWSGGSTGDSGRHYANDWTTGVEGAVFGKGDDDAKPDGTGGNNYIMTGGVLGVSGEASSEATGHGAKVAIKDKFGTRYDDQNPGGQSREIREVSIEASAGLLSGKLAYQFETLNEDTERLLGDKLTFEAAASLPLSELVEGGSEWLKKTLILTSLASIIKEAPRLLDLSKPDGRIGAANSVLLDVASVNALQQSISSAKFPTVEGKNELDGSITLKASIELADLRTPQKPTTASISLSHEGVIGNEGDIIKGGGIKVALEKSSLLMKFNYDGSKLTFEVPVNGVIDLTSEEEAPALLTN